MRRPTGKEPGSFHPGRLAADSTDLTEASHDGF